MSCIEITQADVDAEEARLDALPEYTNVSTEKIGDEWFIDYTLDCIDHRFKFIVSEPPIVEEETIALEQEEV